MGVDIGQLELTNSEGNLNVKTKVLLTNRSSLTIFADFRKKELQSRGPIKNPGWKSRGRTTVHLAVKTVGLCYTGHLATDTGIGYTTVFLQ